MCASWMSCNTGNLPQPEAFQLETPIGFIIRSEMARAARRVVSLARLRNTPARVYCPPFWGLGLLSLFVAYVLSLLYGWLVFFFQVVAVLRCFFLPFFLDEMSPGGCFILSHKYQESAALSSGLVGNVVSFMDGPLKQILKPIRKKAPGKKVLPESKRERT